MDTTSPDPTGTPTIDWGIPVELPADVLHRLFDVADINPVVICHGAVIHTPGQLNLGRSTRLANRAQRRALRALYRTCAIPDCQIRFELCQLHHVWWWEHGGPTDLHNLIPLCVLHHHAIHDRHWILTLTADRQLTITYPDGTTQRADPEPSQRQRPRVAAAGCDPSPADRPPDHTAADVTVRRARSSISVTARRLSVDPGHQSRMRSSRVTASTWGVCGNRSISVVRWWR